MHNLRENVCTYCGDRHRHSPLHKPGCPAYNPMYTAMYEERERVARHARPQFMVVQSGTKLRLVPAVAA